MAALLPEIPFEGWTEAAVRKAALRAGLDDVAVTRLFPGGARDVVAWFSRWADRQTLRALDPTALAALKTRERIARAVLTRLQILAPHREAMRRSLALLAQPQHALLGARLLYEAVDAIWYAAGDTATDFNFYSKRALLAAVLATTTLYWLDDRSEGGLDSAAFLDRRLNEVLRLPQLGSRLKAWMPVLPDPLLMFRLARRR